MEFQNLFDRQKCHNTKLLLL